MREKDRAESPVSPHEVQTVRYQLRYYSLTHEELKGRAQNFSFGK